MTNITLPSESDLRLAFIESMTSLIASINHDAARIAANNFSDDDTDTMPANAESLSFIIATLTNIDSETPCTDAMNATIAAWEKDENDPIMNALYTADGMGDALYSLLEEIDPF